MPKQHACYDCDSEFFVESAYSTEQIVSFCPYCGSELETTDDESEELDFDSDENEDYRD